MTAQFKVNETFKFGSNLYIPPLRDVRPTVGLIPTTLFLLLGDTIEPSVSDPSVPAARPIAAEIPLPLLEPEGSTSGKYGLVA